MKARVAGALLVACAASSAVSCNDIVERRLSSAPLNASGEFPCEAYVDTPNVAPSEGRCVVLTVTFDYSIVVNVPETSQFAAGHTLVIPSKETTTSGTSRRAKLPIVGNVIGSYRVLDAPPLPPNQTIPIRATFTPMGVDPALPLDRVFGSSVVVDADNASVAVVRSLPKGRWSHVFEPEPPYDEVFPPHFGELEVKRLGDSFDIADIGAFDDPPPGTSREARITRAEGLDGWTAWLEDHASKQRISIIKTLSGTEATPRLETVGRGTSLVGVDAVVAPPAGWIGVPRLVGELINGAGLGNLAYPELPRPVALEGIVAASADGGVFLSVTSRVTFDSESINLPTADPRLKYSATVSTDDRGRFATVLPPGTYSVTVEPLEGTGFASFRKQVVVEPNVPITLSPPRRTRVRGLALLGDGRPAANAEVLATPAPVTNASTSSQPPPRPGRTQVREDGTFSVDLDQGAYLFTVIPEPGTGFPRVLTRATIPVGEADIGVVRIPAPTLLRLEIVDPTNLARPIQSANVRIFAPAESGGPPLEMGHGITDSLGRVEILLAQPPK